MSRPSRRHVRLSIAALAVAPLAATALSLPPSSAAPAAPAAQAAATSLDGSQAFHRVATYPVFQNVPAGVDPSDGTVAEISAVSEDGNTIAYTDASGKRIGFVDITDPAAPAGLGSYELTSGDPTSVAIVGDNAFVVIDDSTYPEDGSGYGTRTGRLEVVPLGDDEPLASYPLAGQPDSIAISPDGAHAAIAMENQRNELMCRDGAEITIDPGDIEDSTCSAGELGDLPQSDPAEGNLAGEVALIDLTAPMDGLDVSYVGFDPAALAAAGLNAPTDAEPEYVDINMDNQLVVTLQENNGFAVIDLEAADPAAGMAVFSAGEATVTDIDDDNDARFDFTVDITEEREPDSVQWVGPDLIATANEGDWYGGSRGWSVFDTTTGDVVWDAGNTFEYLAVQHGLFNNDRADNKGSEPEGLAFGTFDGTPYAFVGSERSNFVAVYDMTDPTAPEVKQVLPTTMGPEGLLPIPGRDLLVVSSEEDDAPKVRASLGLYELGPGSPSWPSIVSAQSGDTAPIGWGALSALSPAPGQPDKAYAASDIAIEPGTIYQVDLAQTPAVIEDTIELSAVPAAMGAVDIEGLAARTGGGFWVASEGDGGDLPNALLEVGADGAVSAAHYLPTAIADVIGGQGLEGVSVVGSGAAEQVFVVLQRALPGEAGARIGRYTPATGQWAWWAYPLEAAGNVAGDWIGLSEVTALDADTVAVVERDKQFGTYAKVKRVYQVDLPAPGAAVTPVTKTLAVDLLPRLNALNGWTQEKVEGFTVTSGGQVVAVTDNDGLDDNAGETNLLRLGSVQSIFGAGPSGPAGPPPGNDRCDAAKDKVKKVKKKLKKAKKADRVHKARKLKKKLAKARKHKKRAC